MKEVKCPKCGSKNVVCMDGLGARKKYGANILLDICPEMWICEDCGESFRLSLAAELDETEKI